MNPRGSLFDLGPDGLGFIIPEDEPSRSYAFSIRNLRDIHVATFEEAFAKATLSSASLPSQTLKNQ